MRIAFRTDSSVDIGVGHVMRCLTLADNLQTNNAEIIFITRKHQGNINNLIIDKGYKVYEVTSDTINTDLQYNDKEQNSYSKWLGVTWQEDAKQTKEILLEFAPELLIVDHYAIDFRWHNKLRMIAKNIMVIDDLADRRLDCDFLLDQTYGRKIDAYKSLVNKQTKLLIGTEYALLRPEFAQLREEAIKKRKSYTHIKRIMVSIGGMDSENVTDRVLKSLAMFDWTLKPTVDVIMGGQSPHLSQIIELAEQHPLSVNVQIDVNNMAELMLEADLGIGSAGSTSWERCTLALPSLVIVLADNQKVIASMLEKAGAISLWKENIDLQAYFEKISANENIMVKMQDAAAKICDGQGCSRVISELTSKIFH